MIRLDDVRPAGRSANASLRGFLTMGAAAANFYDAGRGIRLTFALVDAWTNAQMKPNGAGSTGSTT